MDNDLTAQQRKLQQQFKDCFNSVDGKAVLKELKEEFYDFEPSQSGHSCDFEAGMRLPLYRILQQLEMI